MRLFKRRKSERRRKENAAVREQIDKAQRSALRKQLDTAQFETQQLNPRIERLRAIASSVFSIAIASGGRFSPSYSSSWP
jgi:hypothetical protein